MDSGEYFAGGSSLEITLLANHGWNERKRPFSGHFLAFLGIVLMVNHKWILSEGWSQKCFFISLGITLWVNYSCRANKKREKPSRTRSCTFFQRIDNPRRWSIEYLYSARPNQILSIGDPLFSVLIETPSPKIKPPRFNKLLPQILISLIFPKVLVGYTKVLVPPWFPWSIEYW